MEASLNLSAGPCEQRKKRKRGSTMDRNKKKPDCGDLTRIDDLVSWNNFAAVSHRDAASSNNSSSLALALKSYSKALMAANLIAASGIISHLQEAAPIGFDLNYLGVSRVSQAIEDEDFTLDRHMFMDLLDLREPQDLPSIQFADIRSQGAHDKGYRATITNVFSIAVLTNAALLISCSTRNQRMCLDLLLAAKEIERDLDMSLVRSRKELVLILMGLHYNEGMLIFQGMLEDLISEDKKRKQMAQHALEIVLDDIIMCFSEAFQLGDRPECSDADSPNESYSLAQSQVLAGMAYAHLLVGQTDEAADIYHEATRAYHLSLICAMPQDITFDEQFIYGSAAAPVA
jgi:hypothetical protein